MSDVIVQSLIVAGVTAIATALATGYVNSRIMESHLKDLRARIERIEHFLNGILSQHKMHDRDGNS